MNPLVTDGPLFLETGEGGVVFVDFADDAARTASSAIAAAARITRGDGPQGELEGVIVAEAARLGLEAFVAGARHPTRIVVQSAAADRAEQPARRRTIRDPARTLLLRGL